MKEKRLDREILASEGCEGHLQAFTLCYCQGKHRHIPDPETAQKGSRDSQAAQLCLPSLQFCYQTSLLCNDPSMRGADTY